MRPRLNALIDIGVVERVGRGREILAQRYYKMVGKKGVYTRKKGLDRDTNKALLLKHIEENDRDGSPLKDLMQVLPALNRNRIQRLLRELKADGKIHSVGTTRAARWHSAPKRCGDCGEIRA
jgi:ATP-dependent DNA helicase RecG